MKICAIVLAAGKGSRMQSDIQKQYMILQGKPVLWYSLKAFEDCPLVTEIYVVAAPGSEDYCQKEIIQTYNLKKVRQVITGGAERYLSVYNGLKAIEDADYVLIHDGARPFVTEEIIARNIETVMKEKACVTAMPSKDTIKLSDAFGCIQETPDRDRVWIIQTPQTFDYKIIRTAYDDILSQRGPGQQYAQINITDDGMIVENTGKQKVKLVMGSYENIKITTPEDLDIAQVFVQKKM